MRLFVVSIFVCVFGVVSVFLISVFVILFVVLMFFMFFCCVGYMFNVTFFRGSMIFLYIVVCSFI